MGGYVSLLLYLGGPSLLRSRFREFKPRPKRVSEQVDAEWAEEIRIRNKKERILRQWQRETAEEKNGAKSLRGQTDGVNQKVIEMHGVTPGEKKDEDSPWVEE